MKLVSFGVGCVIGALGLLLWMYGAGYDVNATRCQTIVAMDEQEHDVHRATIKSLSGSLDLLKAHNERLFTQLQEAKTAKPAVEYTGRNVDLTIPFKPLKAEQVSAIQAETNEIAALAKFGARIEEKLKLGFAKLGTRGK